jgi:hypothetical protein
VPSLDLLRDKRRHQGSHRVPEDTVYLVFLRHNTEPVLRASLIAGPCNRNSRLLAEIKADRRTSTIFRSEHGWQSAFTDCRAFVTPH